MVDSPVLFACHYLQIARAVIELVSITVMYYFIGTQRSSNLPACNITVDSHITIFTSLWALWFIFLLVAFFRNIRLMSS